MKSRKHRRCHGCDDGSRENEENKTIDDTKDNAGRVAGQDTSRRRVDGELTMWTTMIMKWTVTAAAAVADGVEINLSQRRAVTLVVCGLSGTWRSLKTKKSRTEQIRATDSLTFMQIIVTDSVNVMQTVKFVQINATGSVNFVQNSVMDSVRFVQTNVADPAKVVCVDGEELQKSTQTNAMNSATTMRNDAMDSVKLVQDETGSSH